MKGLVVEAAGKICLREDLPLPEIDAYQVLCRNVGCGICKNACPAGAITLEAHRARIDSRNCIHCYCCHELCPQKAVALKQGALSRLFQSQSVHRRRH